MKESRPENELSRGRSKFQRFLLGSVPLNADASIFVLPNEYPVVTTPKVICVESCQWCPIGASGLFIPDKRCRYIGGPSAGSPGYPTYKKNDRLRSNLYE